MNMLFLMGFGGNFMQLNRSQMNYQLTKLLEQEDSSLAEILDQQEVIQEFRSGNEKLMNYFTYSTIEEMISFVTIEPEDDGDTKRCFKLPYIASEILCIENPQFLKKFFMSFEELQQLQQPIQQIQNEYQGSQASSENEIMIQQQENSEETKEQSWGNEDFEVIERPLVQHQYPLVTFEEDEQEVNLSSPVVQDAQEFFAEFEDQQQEQEQEEKEIPEQEPEDMLPKPMLIEVLFQFLRTQSAKNLTLSGYFAKIFSGFLSTTPNDLFKFLHSQEDSIDVLIENLGNGSISEAVQRLICYQEIIHLDFGEKEQFTEYRNKLLQKVVEKLRNGSTQEALNASQILTELLLKSQSILDGQLFISTLQSNNFMQEIASVIVQKSGDDLKHGLSFLETVLQNSTNKPTGFSASLIDRDFDEPAAEPEVNENEQQQPEDQETPAMVQAITEIIPNLAQLLQTETRERQNTQLQISIPKIGTSKLKIIEFLVNAIKLKSNSILRAIKDTDMSQSMLQIFFNNHWNNAMHNAVLRYLQTIIQEEKCKDLQIEIFENCKLIEQMLEIARNAEIKLDSGKSHRKGQMGHVTQLGNMIKSQEGSQEYIQSQCQTQEWTAFLEEYLLEQNLKEQKNLSGMNQNHNMNDNENEDFESRMEFDNDRFTSYNNKLEGSNIEEEIKDEDNELQQEGFQKDYDTDAMHFQTPHDQGLKHGAGRYTDSQELWDVDKNKGNEEKEGKVDSDDNAEYSDTFANNQFWKVPINQNTYKIEEDL